MKNSPGSMIGGIGLTDCVLAEHCSRTMASAASTWSSSTPRTIVAFDSFRNPPDECSRVVRNCAARSASTSAPASSLCTIAITSFTGGVYDRPALTSDAILQDAIRAVARGRDADAALEELLALAIDASGGTGAAALLWDGDRGALAIAGSKGLADGDAERLELAGATDGDPIHRAAHERVAFVDEASLGAVDGGRLSAWPIDLVSDGVEEPLGAIVLIGGRSATEAEGSSLIGALASLIAVTVDRARLASEGAEQDDWSEPVAHSDALTGLANARTLARVIELEIVRAARQASDLCVALFAIDGLTAINHGAGRAAGDNVLREVAAVPAESVP